MVWLVVLFFLSVGLSFPLQAQVLVVRDDRWANESPASRWLVNSNVQNAQRWLRRVRLPYQGVNASALTNGQVRNTLCLLPSNRPDPTLIAKLNRANRIVVFAFVGKQEEAWRQALQLPNQDGSGSVIRKNGWLVALQPFDKQLSDGERAKQLAAWLFDGAKLQPSLQSSLQRRWSAWLNLLMQKRKGWLKEISQRPFSNFERQRQAITILRPRIATVDLSPTSDGTVWLQRLQTLLSEHERTHRALAISLEPREGEIRGVWLHTYAPTDWESVMETLKAANLNCLFFRAGRGGNVVYKSDFLPRDAWAEQSDLDELQNACTLAHQHKIELHAWRVNHHFGTAPDWLKEQMAKEDRLVRDPQGKQALWLNPADPRNQKHEFRAMLELLRYPVSGVHFDYIRYPEVPHYDFDYGEVSRREFEKATGIELIDFPKQVLFGPMKIRYDDWQRSNVTNLVRRVYLAVKDTNPEVAVSAAVWQRHRYYFALIKQDWMRWVKEKILDFVCPMNYTADTSTFAERVREQVSEINGQIPIAPGIGAYLMDEEWQLIEQVKVARDLGADGFVIFTYHIPPIKDFLTALTLGATAQPTYPAHRSPRIVFHLSDGVWLKDMPIIYREGDKVSITAVISKGLLPLNQVQEIRMTLQWERQDGFAQQILKEATLSGDAIAKGATIHCKARILAGTARLIARGQVRFADGTVLPFVRRGPFVKGVSHLELEALISSLLPFRPPPNSPRPVIGVVAEGWSSDRFAKILQQCRMTSFPVRVLEPSYWQAGDVLIIPPLRDVRELTSERAQALRRWVEKGGRLILLSEACGYRAHANLFPEIALVARERAITSLTNGQQRIKLSTRALVLKPISSAVLWRANGDTIAVRGKVGKGIVVLCGIRVPTTDDDPAWQGWEKLIRTLVR